MNKGLQKLVIILGPTASGKTDFGIRAAKDLNGEIISADSRQIYKKMQIGTAKPKGEWVELEGEKRYLVEGVPHYLMDIIDPGKTFTAAEFKETALERIKDIVQRGKLPIIVGGTGLYIWAIVDNLEFPKEIANKKLRESFEEKKASELLSLLRKLDPESAEKIDVKNKRRIIRALEVSITTGQSFIQQRSKSSSIFDVLQIGLAFPQSELFERIDKRIDTQWENGLISEVISLEKQNYHYELSSMSSIGYKQVGCYLRGEVSEKEAKDWFKKETKKYAKRQMTWFKRDKRIVWVERNDYDAGIKIIRDFLK